MFPVPA